MGQSKGKWEENSGFEITIAETRQACVTTGFQSALIQVATQDGP